jgi:alkylmercury lyase
MTSSLRTFNEALLHSCAELRADEAAAVHAAYVALLEGEPIPLDNLAARAGFARGTLDQIIQQRPGLMRFRADGRVQGCLGLSLEPTRHALEIERRLLWVWCVWDGLFIPRVLGASARLTSTCPVTAAAIALAVEPDGVTDVCPPTAVMSFVASNGPAGNGIGACCPFIHLLESEQAGARWHGAHPTGCVLSIPEAWDLARTFVDTKLSGRYA